MDSLQPGLIINNRFKIVERIGSGGVGAVYEVRDLLLERDVALKFLLGHCLQNEQAKLRFEREAEVISELNHSNIIKFFNYGIWNQEVPFMALELLKGHPLDSVLRNEGPLDWKQASKLSIEILSALEYAHKAGVVHRDLKPQNIFVLTNPDQSRTIKVLDFGLARMLDSESQQGRITSTGQLLGTPAYMSPEQVLGKPVDQRGDIYSMAVILFEMISGRLPYNSTTELGLMEKHVVDAPLLLRSVVKSPIPSEIEKLLQKCLSKNPQDRVQTAGQLKSELELLVSSDDLVMVTPNSPLANSRSTVSATAIFITSFLSLVFVVGLAGLFNWRIPGPLDKGNSDERLFEAGSPFVREDLKDVENRVRTMLVENGVVPGSGNHREISQGALREGIRWLASHDLRSDEIEGRCQFVLDLKGLADSIEDRQSSTILEEDLKRIVQSQLNNRNGLKALKTLSGIVLESGGRLVSTSPACRSKFSSAILTIRERLRQEGESYTRTQFLAGLALGYLFADERNIRSLKIEVAELVKEMKSGRILFTACVDGVFLKGLCQRIEKSGDLDLAETLLNPAVDCFAVDSESWKKNFLFSQAVNLEVLKRAKELEKLSNKSTGLDSLNLRRLNRKDAYHFKLARLCAYLGEVSGCFSNLEMCSVQVRQSAVSIRLAVDSLNRYGTMLAIHNHRPEAIEFQTAAKRLAQFLPDPKQGGKPKR